METELKLSELDFEEITDAEFAIGGSRNGGSWNKEKIKEFAKAMAEKCTGKKIKVGIEGFYSKMREDNGAEIVKYASYYSRKVLIEAFEELGVKAKVKTVGTKNNSTQGELKISILGY